MKQKISEDIKETVTQGFQWVKLEVEYLKLTAVEKAVILSSTIAVGAILLFLFLPLFIMLLFSLADVFKMMMTPALAYLCVAGVVCLMMAVIFIFRRQLIFNPISKFITRILLEAPAKK